MKTAASSWVGVCGLDDILPDTGVCARVQGRDVAIFRLVGDALHAIDNVDLKSGASVLSRGLIGNLGERLVVASPLYKHHFDLRTGECLENPEICLRVHEVRNADGRVLIALA